MATALDVVRARTYAACPGTASDRRAAIWKNTGLAPSWAFRAIEDKDMEQKTATHRCGWVALMGPPNAGKSTLLNSYLGQKVAIVTAKPQTTRNQINGILTEPDAQVIFLDTPGVHDARGKLHRLMMQSAWNAMTGGDVILLVLDADLYAKKPHLLDKDVALLAEPIKGAGRPLFVALNKVDLFHDKSKVLPIIERLAQVLPGADFYPVSALTGEGLPVLLAAIKEKLPQGPAMYPEDQLATAPVRFMVAEIIREKLMHNLFQELPYSVAVDIEQWEEDAEKNLTHINAVIYVARRNHKSMVIGKGGRTLKEVGSAARKEIQDLLDHKVFLELWVKVKEGWTEDPNFLHTLGLGLE